MLANVNASTTITEASVPGYRLTGITCSGLGTGGAATPTLPAIHAAGGGNVVLDAAATAMGSTIQCTFNNQRVPILRLQKSIPNGRAVAGNQFTLRIADGATIVQSATTTGTGSTATGIATLNQAVAGTTYTLSEIPAGSPLTVLDNYLTTYSCTNALAGGQTPSGAGTSFDVTPVAGDDLTCTFTNTFRPRLTIRKTSVGGTGSFSFSGDNGFADQTLVTATPGTPVSGALQGLAAVNTVTTITEDEPPPGYALTGASCTGFPTGGAATVDLAARTLTLNAAATAPGANVTCTFTNTLVPVVTIRKTSLGGTGSFDFSGSNGIVSQTLVTTESGTPVSGVTQVLTTPGVSTTITEAVPPTGYALTGIACTGMAGSGTATANLGTRTVTLNAAATAAGANIVCTFTNTLRPLVTVRKISEGGIGSFAFTGSNGIAAQTLVTTASGVPLGGTPQALTTPGTATTITESAPPTGYVLTDITCTDLPVGGTATPNLGTRTVTLNAAATVPGANVTCTFTNARPAIIRLQKSLPGGRAVAGNQFTLRIADGATVLQSATTTGTGSTATGVATLNPAVAGTTYTLSEIAAGSPVTVLSDYATTYSCINAFAGGQTPIGTGTSFDVTPVLGDDLTCTFANARSADLSISKTDGATTYTPGQAITYTIVASNAGPSPVVGARVSDPFPAAITGVTWTCGSGTGGGTCGAASGSGNLSNAVANLPSGATVTFLATGIVADSATGNLTNTATITGPAVGSPADPDLGNNSATDTDTYIAPPPPVFACNANTIYSIPFLSSGLTPVSRIDVNTGGSATFVTLPATPSGTTWNGLGINPASDLVHAVTEGLGSSNAGRVLTYTLGTPPSSATLSPAPSNRYSGGFVAGAVNPVTGWYYSAAPISNGSSTLVLFAYDPAWGATQAPIEVGRINTTGTGGDLTFDSLGNLYLLSGSTVYRVDGPVPQSSSTATLPASVVTVSSSGGVGIAFSNGELIFQSNTTYRRFNPTTGALIGSFTSIGGTDLASCESPSTIRLRKNLPDGRVVTGDQFGLAITLTAGGTILGNTATTTGSASGMQPAIAGPVLGLAGTSYTLTETAAGTTNLASYTSSLTCTNETNGSPVDVTANASGQSGTFVMPDNGGAGSNILCTFTNSGSATDLSIAKTSTVSEVLAGSTISYDIVVINNGPSAADNATVSDDWITLPGLDCSAGPVTCAASGTAGTQCPAVGSVTPAALQAGLAIPALPNGGIVTLTVQCAVTASGL